MIVLILLLVFGLVGYAIGKPKGNPIGGFVVGFLLGPLGWLFIAVSGKTAKQKRREQEALSVTVATAVAQALEA